MSATIASPREPFLQLPGFMPDAVPFAIRTATSLLLAYLVSFAIQLDTASSAGVCVAIVVQSSPGMALSKAAWRVFGTLVGGVVALALIAAFAQDRTMLLAGFTVWLAACTFVAALLRDFRSYGAVLAGYTVGIIAVGGIDAPDGVFLAATNRVAAILIGVGAVATVNAVLSRSVACESVLRSLQDRLEAADALARRGLSGETLPDDTVLAETGAAILALRTEAGYAALELPGGRRRRNAASAAIAGLLGMISTSRALGASAQLTDGPARAVFRQERAAELARHRTLAQDSLDALREQRPPREVVALRAHNDVIGAALSAGRTLIAVSVCCVFCVYGGWTGATLLLIQQSAFTALLGMQPNPTAAALNMTWALPPAALAAGVAGFLLLPLASGFVPFALVVGAFAFAAALAARHPWTVALGPGFLLYFTLLLSPSNTQAFDLSAFANTTFVQVLAIVFMLLGFRLVLPVARGRRLARLAGAMAQDLRRVLRGRARLDSGAAARSLRFDRLAQAQVWLGQLTPARRKVLLRLCRLAELDAAVRRAQRGLAERGEALPAPDPVAYETRAEALLGAEPPGHWDQLAISGLFEAADLLRSQARALRHYGVLDR